MGLIKGLKWTWTAGICPMIEIEDIVIDPTLVSFAGLSENSKSFCRSLVLHYNVKRSFGANKCWKKKRFGLFGLPIGVRCNI